MKSDESSVDDHDAPTLDYTIDRGDGQKEKPTKKKGQKKDKEESDESMSNID